MRDELYYASIFAGLELNSCKAGFPHTMGYALTEDFHLPHGRACTAFLPEYVKRGAMVYPERGKRFFELLGCNLREFEAVVTALTDADYIKMTREQISDYVSRWSGVANFARSPGGFTLTDAKALLTKLFLK